MEFRDTEKFRGTKDESLLSARLVYDPETKDPGRYADENRRFQGIPGIETTTGGRLFFCFYSGTDGEGSGNFVLLYAGESEEGPFRQILAVEAPTEKTRTFDPCLWIDDRGRLWLFWAQSYTWFDGRVGVWAAVCPDPDAETVRFSSPRRIADGIMMNKPIVTRNGSWLLCCALWEGFPSEYNALPEERFPNVVRSADGGESFWKIGHADWPDRLIDEPMAAELSDGRVWMLIRGKKGIGQSFSSDGGFTWSPGEDSRLGGPGSRFCLRRLKSGRLLLVNHYNYTGRNNLTAMLSEDDGRSWKGFLTLDGRDDVSYPDAAETADGRILIVYDRKRYTEKEILLAAVTEADILEGRPVSPLCRLKTVLNRAAGGNPNP